MFRLSKVLAYASQRGFRAPAMAVSLLVLTACTLIVPFIGITSDDPEYQLALRFDAIFFGAPLPGLALRAKPSAVASPVTLETYTPKMPFRGNQLAIVGGALDTATSRTGAILVRQADCSLTQYGIGNVNGTASTITQVLPGADAYLHRISGLTTTPGTFPKGCVDRTLGLPSTLGTFLGQAANGDLLSVLVNPSSGQITLLRFGTTGVPVNQTVLVPSGAAFVLAAADLNGDGIADIVTPFVTVNGASGVGVLLSHSDGSFDAPVVYPGPATGTGRFSAFASIDDVDGDGKPDIVTLSAASSSDPGTLAILPGRGDGSFGAGSSRTVALSPASFELADFNGDGRKDVLTASGNFLAGDGVGGFAAPVATETAAFFGQHLAVGDFNGDGKLDVAMRQGTFIQVALGRGDGGFVVGATYAAVRGAEYLSVSDINGDGHDDIVVGLAGPRVFGPNTDSHTVTQFLFGRGDGSFVAAQALPGAGVSLFGAPTFAVADFNGDGLPEVVALAPDGASALALYPGSNTGTLGPASTTLALSARPFAVASADVDGDGKPDLVVVSANELSVLRGQGGGAFAPALPHALPAVDGRLGSMALGDFNGDGRADVVVTFGHQSASTGGAFVYIANADGTLKPPVQIDPAVNLSAAVADLDRDGLADLVLVGGNADFFSSPQVFKGLRVYRGQADGSFIAPQSLAPPTGITYASLALGDMNKDGNIDAVLVGRDSGLNDSLYVLPGQGNGSFGAATPFPLPGGGPGVGQIAVADYTGDGKLDVFLAGRNYSGIAIGNGDGTFSGMGAVAIASRANRVVAADLNGDGMVDAVVGIDFQGIVPLVRTAAVVTTPPTGSAPFTAALSASSGSVAGRGSVPVTLNFSFATGFTDTVSLTCGALPPNATCSFAPASVTAANASSVLTISTGVQPAALATTDFGAGPGSGSFSATLAALLALAAALIYTGRVRWAPLYRPIGLGAVVAMGLVAGCGGSGGSGGSSSPPQAVTPAGTYTVPITATAPGATQTLNYTLTVN